MMNNDDHEKMGPSCKTCGHPAGAHGALGGADPDEPNGSDACRYDGCECRVFAAEV